MCWYVSGNVWISIYEGVLVRLFVCGWVLLCKNMCLFLCRSVGVSLCVCVWLCFRTCMCEPLCMCKVCVWVCFRAGMWEPLCMCKVCVLVCFCVRYLYQCPQLTVSIEHTVWILCTPWDLERVGGGHVSLNEASFAHSENWNICEYCSV